MLPGDDDKKLRMGFLQREGFYLIWDLLGGYYLIVLVKSGGNVVKGNWRIFSG